ncbi:hypothetical protein C8J57DRAFT_1241513 [Mycena rebaudengoi]|nr:hypothetical protein C8J57DRAFT_1241513 [Mycena rebaudengoi]
MSRLLGLRTACSTRACTCDVFILEDPDISPRYTVHFFCSQNNYGSLRIARTLKMWKHSALGATTRGSPMDSIGTLWRKRMSDLFVVVPVMGDAGVLHLSNPVGICGSPACVVFCGPSMISRDAQAIQGSYLITYPSSHLTPRRSSTSAIMPPISSSSSTVSTVMPQRPVMAFTGLPRPAVSVAQQRRDSMHRNLPQHQPTGSDARKVKKARLSGPPRFSGSASSSSAFNWDDFASPSASSSAVQPSLLTVCIVPKVLNTSNHNNTLDPSPHYFWPGLEDLEEAQQRLQVSNLVFTVTVPLTGPIFKQINTEFIHHCQTNNIDYLASATTSATGPTPNMMPWVLLGPKGRSAPRLRNLYDPIDSLFTPMKRLPDYILSHRCFGRRVLWPILESLDDDEDFTPSDSDVHFPEAEELIDQMVIDGLPPLNNHTAQSSSSKLTPHSRDESETAVAPVPITTRAASRRQWQEEAAAEFPAGENTIAPLLVGPLLLSAVDRSSGESKIAPLLWEVPWISQFIWCQGQGQRLSPHDRCRPHGLKFKEIVQEQFTAPRPTIDSDGPHVPFSLLSLHVQIGPGFGKGPRAEVLSRAIEILMADPHYWTDVGEYKTLRLHPSHTSFPRRSCILKNLEFLSRFISPSSLAMVSTLHSTDLTDLLYTSEMPTCTEFQYLLNVPECDPTVISSSRRSQEEQDGISTSLVSFITLGSINIERHPDFLDFCDGFNVALEPSGTPKVCTMFWG